MRSLFKGHLRAAAAVAALVLPTSVAAQEAEQVGGEESYSSGDIVVTAQKRSQSINDVPLTVAAATGTQLLDRGISDPSDLGKVVPGFTYQPAPTGIPVFTLRGVGYYDEALAASPAVSVYVDEVPLPFSIMANGVAFDLERVEVLKGPQGTLFGQNSTGGAINYIAARPTEEFSGGFNVSYGSYNAAEAQAHISGALSDTLKGRIAVRMAQGGSWQRSYTRDDKLGDQNMLQGRLLLDWRPTDRLKVALNLNGWVDKGDTQAPQVIAITPQVPAAVADYVANFPLAPAKAKAADWGPNREFRKDDSFYQGSLRVDYDLTDDIVFTSLSAYSRMDRDAVVDGDGMPYDNVDLRNYGYLESIDQELRLTVDLDRVNLVLGGNYQHNRTKDHRTFYIADASNNELIPGFVHDGAELRTRQKVDTYALFGNAEYEISDTVSLIGGLRYTKQDRAAVMCSADAGNHVMAQVFTIFQASFQGKDLADVTPIAPDGCLTFDENFDPGPVSDTLNEDNLSWRAGVNWKPNRDMLFYATLSRGYKSGSFPTIFATTLSQDKPVVQETLLAYEAGAKLTLGSAQVNLAGFYYDYKDKQLLGKALDPNFGVLQALVNVPKSTLYGAELQVMASPVRGLDLSFAATYTHSNIDEYIGLSSTGVPDDLSGSPFPYPPKLQIASDAQYEWDAGSNKSLFVGTGVTYASATTGGIGAEPLLRIKPYAIVDVRAGLKSDDGWRFSIWGRNIFDTYYWTNAQRTQDTTLRLAGKPATFGATFGVDF